MESADDIGTIRKMNFDSIEDFKSKWMMGGWGDSARLVTNDGLNVFRPANAETLQALDEFKAMDGVIVPYWDQEILSSVGLNDQEQKRIFTGVNKFIDTEAGRVFWLNGKNSASSELFKALTPSKAALKDVGLMEGSLYFEDTAIFKDDGTESFMFIDVRKEVLEPIEVTSRSLEKGAVLIFSNQHRNEGTVMHYAFGDDKVLKTIEPYYLDLYKEKEVFRAGYSNSEENPMPMYELSRLLENNSPKKYSDKNGEEDKYILQVSNSVINQAGSKGGGFYLDAGNNEAVHIKPKMHIVLSDMRHMEATDVDVYTTQEVASKYDIKPDHYNPLKNGNDLQP